MRRYVLPVCLIALLTLNACSSDKKPPLKGERISVLQMQNSLEIDKSASETAITLPDAKETTAWPQAGGNATHMPEHIALGAHLKKAWSTDIGTGSKDDRKLVTAPIIANNHAFAADTEGNISAYQLSDGKKIWRIRILPKHDDTTVSAGLAFGDNVLFATDGNGGVVAMNPETGATIWQKKMDHPVRSSPTYLSGRLYLISLSDETYALDAQTGNVLWTHKGIEEAAGLLGTPSPAAQDSVVMTLYSSGDIVALRAETGQEAWSDNLTGVLDTNSRAVTQLSGFHGHPVIDGDNVIVGNNASRIVSIHVPSGERTWQKEFGANETPWVAGNVIFVLSSQNEVICVLKETGQIRWVTPLDRYKDPKDRDDPIFWNGPVLAGGRLIIAGSNGKMLELDPQTGKITNKTDISGMVMLSPVVAQNTLLLLSDNGTLTAYK
jgi:outer membrane protein assembly factor BamB